MVAHRIRLAGVDYLICDVRQRAPGKARLLGAAEFRGLLDAHRGSPRVRALIAELEGARPEQLRHQGARGHQRAIDTLRCYELEAVIPKVSGPVFAPSLPAPTSFEPSEMFDEEPHWVEVLVVGEDDQALAGVSCEITLPSGKVVRRTTDRLGLVRIDGITSAGSCSLSLPELDQDAWEPA